MMLSSLINKSWLKGELPKAWRIAIIKPLLKKGKPADEISSYRPVSLTSCMGKLAERMINARLYWWLESNKIVSAHQAGFRVGQRTEDVMFRITQRIIDGFHSKKTTVGVFVDLPTTSIRQGLEERIIYQNARYGYSWESLQLDQEFPH